MWCKQHCPIYKMKYPPISDLPHFTEGREEANIATLQRTVVLLSWNLYDRAEGAPKQRSRLHATTCLTWSSAPSIFRIEEVAPSRKGSFPYIRGVMEAWNSCTRQQRDGLHGIVAKPAVRKSHKYCLSTVITPWSVQERGTTDAKQDKTKTQLNLSACQQENRANESSRQRLWYQRQTQKIWKAPFGITS